MCDWRRSSRQFAKGCDDRYLEWIDNPDEENTLFENCVVDTDFNGECVDDHGATWIFEGEVEYPN